MKEKVAGEGEKKRKGQKYMMIAVLLMVVESTVKCNYKCTAVFHFCPCEPVLCAAIAVPCTTIVQECQLSRMGKWTAKAFASEEHPAHKHRRILLNQEQH